MFKPEECIQNYYFISLSFRFTLLISGAFKISVQERTLEEIGLVWVRRSEPSDGGEFSKNCKGFLKKIEKLQ